MLCQEDRNPGTGKAGNWNMIWVFEKDLIFNDVVMKKSISCIIKEF